MRIDNVTAVILCGTAGRRMKCRGPKCLIKINNKSILQKSVENIRNTFTNPKIYIISGFEKGKVLADIENYIDSDIKLIHNEEYLDTNPAYALSLLENKKFSDTLIINGDLVYNKSILHAIDYDNSGLLVDTKNYILDNEVGIAKIGDEIKHMGYAHPLKWLQIAYLKRLDFKKYIDTFLDQSNEKLLFHEVINIMLNHNFKLKAYEPRMYKLIEIDCIKDLKRATEVFEQE